MKTPMIDTGTHIIDSVRNFNLLTKLCVLSVRYFLHPGCSFPNSSCRQRSATSTVQRKNRRRDEENSLLNACLRAWEAPNPSAQALPTKIFARGGQLMGLFHVRAS